MGMNPVAHLVHGFTIDVSPKRLEQSANCSAAGHGKTSELRPETNPRHPPRRCAPNCRFREAEERRV